MQADKSPHRVNFPVVGIGASAGGYPALLTLLQNMPPHTGMAIVVILHLAPGEPSSADRLLQRATAMPVVQVTHTMPILPDQVYVIPPARSLAMRDGALELDHLERGGQAVAIDFFLRTLAEAHRELAIGVVLSGMGSDGTAGMACIKEMGGVSIAQLPADAEHPSMPRSVIDSGMADFVLAARDMPDKLVALRETMDRIRQQAGTGTRLDGVQLDLGVQPEAALHEVLALLRERTGHDFTHYRRPTLLRCLERRAQVRGVPDLAAYHRVLAKDSAEAPALLKDLLIGVTGFYRDREAFAALDRVVLPRLFETRRDSLRAWVAACSSGEEAYSVAMLLAERASGLASPVEWQLFASDIDEHALASARAGLYPPTIAESVPQAQLQRWFTRQADQYKVRKQLRERILFARHNLLQEPAFSRLDLITCRNFLIYLNREMHRQVLQRFHFALHPGGFLMLGGAESADAAADLFEPVDTASRIYRAKRRPLPAPSAAAPAVPPSAAVRGGSGADLDPSAARRSRLFSFAEIHQNKAAELAPPSILLDAEGEILHISEQAAGYLRQAGGEPTRELARLVPPELQVALRAALFQARRSGRRASTGPIRCARAADAVTLEVQVLPFQDPHADGGLLLARFMETPCVLAQPVPAQQELPLLRQLDDELRQTRNQLRETIEHAEAAGNDTRLYREEMQTSMDELRASVAELTQGRDLLQAENQELLAVREELQKRVADTAKAHDDLVNLVASSGVATLFLDREMRILRYTPYVVELFNLIPADLGRPLLHITSRLDYPGLVEEAAEVFTTLLPREREVRCRDGRYYIVRMHPYRTNEDRIEGTVLTFFDITCRRAAEEALRASEERLRLFVSASSDMLYRMSADWSEMQSLQGKTLLADTAQPSRDWRDAYVPQEDRGQVEAAIAAAVAGKTAFELEHRVIGADGGLVWVSSRAIPLLDARGEIVEWFGAAVDISGRKRDEQAMRESAARLSTMFASLPVGVGVIDADGRMILSNRVLERYLPSGFMPSRDPVRGSRWRSWDAQGRALAFDEFPGARALRGEQVVPGLDMLYRQDDGREVWARIAAAAIFDDRRRATGEIAVVITDIDALKRNEQALRETEERLRELLGGVAEAVWETDAEGCVVADSPSWRAYTGTRVEEWLGERWIDAVHPDDRDDVMRQWKDAVARRGAFDLVFRQRRAEGGWHRTRVRALPLFKTDGTVRKWVGMNVSADGA